MWGDEARPLQVHVEAARFWAKLTKCDLPGEPWHPERIWYYGCVHLRAVHRPAFVPHPH